jgi:hypothetical protein
MICEIVFAASFACTPDPAARPARDRLQPLAVDSLVITSPDSFSNKSLRELLVDAGKRARTLKRTPFLELGAPWCGPCQELQQLLDTKPTNPVVLEEFSHAYIIRLNVDTWKREFVSIGFSGKSIPVFLSIDTTGMVTDSVSLTQWRANTPEGLRTVQAFFKAHAWVSDVPDNSPAHLMPRPKD